MKCHFLPDADCTTIVGAFNYIESIEFTIWTNIASGLNTFVHILEEDDAVKYLDLEMNGNEVAQQIVFDRLKELGARPVDGKYENVHDTAIAVYSWLIMRHIIAADRLTEAHSSIGKNLWWGRRIWELYKVP